MRKAALLLLAVVVACTNGQEESDDVKYLTRVLRGNGRGPSKEVQFALTEYMELVRREAPVCFAEKEYLREQTIRLLIEAMVYIERRPAISTDLQITLEVCHQLADYASKIIAIGDKIAISHLLQTVRHA